ncbi:MAG: magnesium protoporphyrin IX methyltransferase [Cyanobacteria bacterium P01_F01_bin.150]
MTATNEKIGNDKSIVKDYFNSKGFDRWRRIYGETDDVNKVQLNIRKGHQKTVNTVIEWLKEDSNLTGFSICDAGCGVGSLSIPLAKEGAIVYASDISEKMVEEGRQRAQAELGQDTNPIFEAKDLESLTGTYHTVVCLDVLIHYTQEKAADMISRLSSLASDRILISFAPKTCRYALLKKIGDFFPGPSKATRAYLHREADVIKVLEDNGWTIKRKILNKAPFYFSQLLEATK